jgi:glycosyltransferase involved in cell wall biosynthesis
VAEQLRVAVAMATFNGERFIAEQLESILNQTRLPDEIVISDDHSADKTLAMAKKILEPACAERGIDLTIVSHDGPAGVSANFHHAVSQTTADIIALADQDDVWHADKLETLVSHFEALPKLLMVHSDADLIDDGGASLGMGVLESLRITGRERHDLVTSRGIQALVRRNLVTGQTALIRRSLVDLSAQIPEGWVHDEWWGLIAASMDGLLLDPRVFQSYRQHAGNEIGASKSGWERLKERLSEPQTAFRDRHKVRHQGLELFMEGPLWPGHEEATNVLRGRLRHYAWQAQLPAAKILRLGPILWKLMSGEYSRYRRGFFDAMRDFLQPAS